MEKNRYSVPALEKGLTIIEMLTDSTEPLGITDIYERCKLPKSSIFMILMTLEELGYVQKVGDGKYRLTLKIYNLGITTLSKLDIRSLARPVMEEIAEELKFTVHLAMLEKGKAIYIEKVEGPGFVQFSTRVGQSMYLHNSGVGKALAAHIPEEQLDQILELHGMPLTTPNTLTTPDDFKQFLEYVRECGYAVEDEEGELSIRCIASPIYNHKNEVIAALGITCLRNELASIHFAEIGNYIRDKALYISRKLGYGGKE